MSEEIPHDLNNLPPEERDRIINEIIEQVIRPQLDEMTDKFSDPQGEAFVFGGNDEEQAKETMERLQALLQEGLSMDYILQEMTDLGLTGNIARQVGDMTINFISIDADAPNVDDAETLSADELRAMFERS